MLTSSASYIKSSSHASSYYSGNSKARSDYYKPTNDDDMFLTFWHGKAASILDLEHSHIDSDVFNLITSNQSPKGEKLKPRNSSTARIGLDFTFTAPKSISVAYALTNDENILHAFQRAVKATLSIMEGYTKHRDRENPKGVHTGKMLTACFTHRTARPNNKTNKPDPHLHMHCLVINTTYNCTLGEWRALDYEPLKTNAKLFQDKFHLKLAEEIEAVGYAIRWKDSKPELREIYPELIDKFSTRQKEIKAYAKANSLDMKEQQEYARYSRQTKCTESFSQLQSFWRSQLNDSDIKTLSCIRPAEPKAQYDMEYGKLLADLVMTLSLEEELNKHKANDNPRQ
jgi:conjugative relaxase-like TrwC/TraI family protein